MTTLKYLRRSLRFYWRTSVGVLLGVALASAILTGALVVGDSIRFSLRCLALARLGRTELALAGGERFFREKLANQLSASLGSSVAPGLLVRGVVATPDGSHRANDAQVAAVDSRFWKLGAVTNLLDGAAADEVVINQSLATQLDAGPGETVIIRIEPPAWLSRDAPLSGATDQSITLRVRIRAVAGDREFGRFSLQANQVSPRTVFVPLPALQQQLDRPGRVNTLLIAGAGDRAPATADAVRAALGSHWALADAGLALRTLPELGKLELITDRVFLEPVVVDAVQKVAPEAIGVLTYLVNEIRHGDRSTPYSMITAVDPQGLKPLPANLGRDEIVLNSWLAEDLGAQPGDEVSLRYFVVGDRRELQEATSRFRVRVVIPLEGVAADPSWMPAFPGLSDVENCRDWKPGIPIDTGRIRPKDQEYWDLHRGAPKAFLTLEAGQRLWSNRFGNRTALRVSAEKHPHDEFAAALLGALDPAALGLFLQPVRQQALQAAMQSLDFGQLFLGFSFFLILAALLLTALLFVFNVEQRSEEVGLLLAVGFRPSRVRRLLLGEGLVLTGLGVVLGLAAGALYTRSALHGLATVWREAVGTSALQYRAEPLTMLTGVIASVAVALLAIWWSLRKQARQAPAGLLARGAEAGAVIPARSRRRLALAIAVGCIVAATGLLAVSVTGSGQEKAGGFFGAGMLMLVAGVSFGRYWLGQLARTRTLARSLRAVGWRNAVRRPGRTLTIVTVLASGVFLVVAVNAFRHDPAADALRRDSGTGGFALIGQSTLPIYEDLNRERGREQYGLSALDLEGVHVVAMRVRDGDDASCLNLNRALQPRLLGVPARELRERKAFTFQQAVDRSTREQGWAALEGRLPDGAIPCVGDLQTVTWAMGKAVGDTVTYPDDQGQPVQLRIVAVLAASVLQGSLLISEAEFTRHFPSAGGYRTFLIDTPWDRTESVAGELARALQDRGLELVPTTRRLAEYLAVENTYLAIFQALGGLGLLLGTLGLAIVVLRNVLERRGELALLEAIGFRRRSLQGLVLSEHWLLVVIGLALGMATAVVGVLPAAITPGMELPLRLLGITLAALLAGGLWWCWLAARLALHGPLLPALRKE